MENNNIKKDCFAFLIKDGKEQCNALRELYCKNEKCNFYMTRQEYVNKITKINKDK